jgi:hypothetical protein
MRVVAPLGQPAPGPTRRAVASLLGGAFLVAACTTLIFLGMRSVMDVGGFCAEGGPYVIQTPCPEGSPAAMLLGIFGWFGGAALLFVGGIAVGGGWAAAGILAWSALFGALGWNFLEYAVSGEVIAWGWLICGIVFEAMAVAPLLVVVPAALSAARSGREAAPTSPGPSTRPAPADAAGPFGPPADTPDDALVASLERLAALHASGHLTDEEFARAKDAVLDADAGSAT